MGKQERGMIPGTVELVILRTLSHGQMHGFQVSRAIRARSDGVLDLKDAALYQALHRMEKDKLVEAEWGVSERGRRAKFYRLTTAGRRRLERERRFWKRYTEAMAKVLAPDPQAP